MSDCDRNIFSEKEDFQVVLGKGDNEESSCQRNYMWLTHWSRASSSAYGKSCSPFEDASNSSCTKDFGTSLFELKTSNMAERLMLGRKSEAMKNMQQLNSNMWGVAHDVWQEAEQNIVEQRDGSFQSSILQMQRDENFYAKTVVSETLSVHRLPDLPLDFQKLVNSDENLDSHWNRLLMLSINHKVDSMLNPKRRSATGTVFSDLFVPQQTPMLNMAPSNLMELSQQEYELQSHRRTDRIMDHCKPARGIRRLREDPTCLTFDPTVKKLKFDNSSLSDSLIDDKDTYHYFANPNQEPLSKCSEKMFNFSENNDKDQRVGGAFQSQKSRTPAGLHERQPQEECTDYSKEKIPCLFEVLTTPSDLQSSYAKDSLYSGKPSGFGVGLYGPNIDIHLFGAQNKFSPTTEKLHGDAHYVSKSSAGITSSLAQKDNGCAEKANEQLATLSIKGSPGCNEEGRSRVNQDISSRQEQDLCTPCTETMDLDPPSVEPSRLSNRDPNSPTQSPTRTDPTYRWLKRLCHEVADPRVECSKRPKTGDCCPVGGESRMSDTDTADQVAEKSVHFWLGRWCQGGGAPVSHGDPDQRVRAAAKPNAAAGELGVAGHFPSIKAMAMMGRVMSKVRPLDRQRKGPCVMWKSEGA